MNIKALILDMDGVLWRGNEPIGDLARIFDKIASRNLTAAFATNNATRTVEEYIEKLAGFGIKTQAERVYTSAWATAELLHELHPSGGKVFTIGTNGLRETLRRRGFEHAEQDVLAVVVGMNVEVNYAQIGEAALLVRAGVPFYGTNPDKSFPTPRGLMPGNGAILAAIEAASDTPPTIVGKPKGTMFLQALAQLGIDPAETLCVGDRLETDIAGGQAAGCKTACVLSGVSTREMAEAWSPSIDYIAEDLNALLDQIE
jgi:4-nitrophenyl phosphatase